MWRKESLQLPLREQLKVPTDMLDVRSAVTVKENSRQLLYALPKLIQDNKDSRKAEVFLPQFFKGHVSSLHTVAFYREKRKKGDAMPVLTNFETYGRTLGYEVPLLEHIETITVGRNPARRKPVRALIRHAPNKFLTFLKTDNLF